MKEMGQPLEGDKLEALLANVERRARVSTSPSAKARMYNLAGDLCFDAHQPDRALVYYGQAVKAHVSADQYDHAISICKKLIALSPHTVRMHYTVTWLTSMRGLIAEARRSIAEYSVAAERAGLGKLARRHSLGLTEMTNAEELLDAIADNVARLGDNVSADWIHGQLNRMNGKPAA